MADLFHWTSPSYQPRFGPEHRFKDINSKTKQTKKKWYLLGIWLVHPWEREKTNQVVFCVVKFLSGPENDSVPLPVPTVESSATRVTLWFCAPNQLNHGGTWYYLSLEGYPVSPRSPLSSGLFCCSFLTCQNNTHSASNVCPFCYSLSYS